MIVITLDVNKGKGPICVIWICVLQFSRDWKTQGLVTIPLIKMEFNLYLSIIELGEESHMRHC